MRLDRTAASLNPRLIKRLTAYAVAGVAGFGVASPGADGAIVYTSVKQFGESQLGTQAVVSIDLNRDGIIDFNIVGEFVYQFNSFSRTHTAFVYVGPHSGAVAGSQHGYLPPSAAALDFGQKIGPELYFVPPLGGRVNLAFLLARPGSVGVHYGNFYNQTNKFLGLKFELNGKTYYGWARVNVRRVFEQPVPGKNFLFEVVDYAYQDRADTSLRAGEGIPQADVFAAQPEADVAECVSALPATLGLLAYGADAIPAWRR